MIWARAGPIFIMEIKLEQNLVQTIDYGGAHAVAPSLQGGLGIIVTLLGTAGNPSQEEHGNNRHLHRIIEGPYKVEFSKSDWLYDQLNI